VEVYCFLGESNGKLPLRTFPECSVPEPYRLPDWALVPANTGPRAEYQINQSLVFTNGYRVFSGGRKRPGRDADSSPLLVPRSKNIVLSLRTFVACKNSEIYLHCFLQLFDDWQPYHLHVPIVLISGSLNLLEPYGPLQTCNGIALPVTSLWHGISTQEYLYLYLHVITFLS
jgi:hypothetical protein